jgi:hypothetical protein
MEACPNGCEDPTHPGHVLSYSVNHRPAHLASCPERPIQCLLCQPLHSLPDSKLSAHVDWLLTNPSTRALVEGRLVSEFRNASTKPDSGHGAKSAASAPAAVAPASSGSSAFRPAASAAAAPAVPASVLSLRSRAWLLAQGFGAELRIGDKCDCFDTEQKWRHAEIMNRNATHVQVH